MDNELTIIITGRAGSGKSTMMLQLEKLLVENGFNTQFSFKNHPDYSGENTYHFRNKEEQHFDEKINAIKSSTKIILKEVQLNCEPNKKIKREAYTNC